MKKAIYVLVLIISATAIFVLATLPARTVFGWFANDQVRAFYAALGFDVEDMLRLKIR